MMQSAFMTRAVGPTFFHTTAPTFTRHSARLHWRQIQPPLYQRADLASPLRAACCSRQRTLPSRSVRVRAASNEDSKPGETTKFGYNRKDIILLGAGLIGLGYALYYGLQATGMEAGQAGNVVQITIFLGICVGYISTYIFRVANKDMTYVKQLEDYEEAVMARRLAEMPPDELDRLMTEVDEETRDRAARKKKLLEAAEKAKGGS